MTIKENGEEIVELSVKDFVDLGFLQEVNRLVLHPCGLALSVKIDENENYSFGPIWDYRDDPEGILFGDDLVELPEFAEKIKNVSDEFYKHLEERRKIIDHAFQIPKNML